MVGDCLDDHSMRLSHKNMAQKNYGDEILACEVNATQIKSVLVITGYRQTDRRTHSVIEMQEPI